MENLCPKGHDKNKVGITKWRRCRACERVRLQKKAQKLRDERRTTFRYPLSTKRVKPARDGLEAEYGPVPDLVPDEEWYDEVIVIRALSKQPTGRLPYPLEWAEIIRRMPRAEVLDEDVAEATGTTVGKVSKMREKARRE